MTTLAIHLSLKTMNRLRLELQPILEWLPCFHESNTTSVITVVIIDADAQCKWALSTGMADNKWVTCSMILIPVPFLQTLTSFVKFLWPIYGTGFVYYDCMLTNNILYRWL